jgi:hypothetical protein
MTDEELLDVIAGEDPSVPRPVVSMKILKAAGIGRGIGFVKFV